MEWIHWNERSYMENQSTSEVTHLLLYLHVLVMAPKYRPSSNNVIIRVPQHYHQSIVQVWNKVMTWESPSHSSLELVCPQGRQGLQHWPNSPLDYIRVLQRPLHREERDSWRQPTAHGATTEWRVMLHKVRGRRTTCTQ